MDCPVLLLGCGFTGKAAGCESVYTLFHRRRLRSDNSCSSPLRVGQPRLMPRVERRVFVSMQILQSILDLLHAAGKTERSELNAYAYTVLESEQFDGGVRKHFAHAQTVYTPFFWEGPGCEAN